MSPQPGPRLFQLLVVLRHQLHLRILAPEDQVCNGFAVLVAHQLSAKFRRSSDTLPLLGKGLLADLIDGTLVRHHDDGFLLVPHGYKHGQMRFKPGRGQLFATHVGSTARGGKPSNGTRLEPNNYRVNYTKCNLDPNRGKVNNLDTFTIRVKSKKV